MSERPTSSRPGAGRPVETPGRSRSFGRHATARLRLDSPWFWPALLALLTAVGLVMVAAANAGAQSSAGWAPYLFWSGLLVTFLPAAGRLLLPVRSRQERLALVVLLALALYLVKVLLEPTAFVLHDELGHWRTTDDILRSGQLFQPNPVVRAYAFFPGLEIVTAALVQLTGLSIFVAGTVIIGVVRLLSVVAIYLLLERLTSSGRLASLALLVYVGNPNFLYFDAQYAYESLALPLALLVILLLLSSTGSRRHWSVNAVAVVLCAGTAVSHHLAAYWLTAVLLATSVVALGLRLTSRRGPPAPLVGLVAAAAFSLSWLLLVAKGNTTPELAPALRGALALGRLLTGQTERKRLFTSSSGGITEPLLSQAVSLGSVVLLLLVIPVGLWWLWRHRLRHPLLVVLAASATVYPVTLGLRLTSAGTETSNRASEYVFLGLGLLAAFTAAGVMGSRWHRPPSDAAGRDTRRPTVSPTMLTAGLTAYVTVTFVGGILIGVAPYFHQPGPYLVAADPRSVDPFSVATAFWARAHLPENAVVASDRVNGYTITSYGRLGRQTGAVAGVPVAQLFFSPTFGETERRIIRADKIDYIVVDRRLSTALPLSGVYYDSAEKDAASYVTPVPAASLAKFDGVPQLDRVYDAGPITIYGTARLR